MIEAVVVAVSIEVVHIAEKCLELARRSREKNTSYLYLLKHTL